MSAFFISDCSSCASSGYMQMPMLAVTRHSCASDEHGLDGGGEDLARDRGDLLRLTHFLEQHHELVAAQAGDDVALAQATGEARRDFLQQLVARLVAERVVDQLEAVEVDEQHRELTLVAPCGVRSRRSPAG